MTIQATRAATKQTEVRRTAGKPTAAKRKAGKQTAGKHVTLERRVAEIVHRLTLAITEPRCELTFDNPWQLMIKAILSAQSTDKLVNRIGPALFERWATPAALGAASQEEVEQAIKSTGFFRVKARSIRESSRTIAEQYGGQVPCDFDALLRLRGVARKTANVVMGTGFGVETGVVVDTHMTRVSQRLGLTTKKGPEQIEKDLVALLPKGTWIDQSHRLVLHGRYVCMAKKPLCAACPVNELCPSAQHAPEGTWQERAAQEQRIVETQGKWRPPTRSNVPSGSSRSTSSVRKPRASRTSAAAR
jgi:endonuclease-3